MKKFFSFIILASFLLTSCSSMNVNRTIATQAVNAEAEAAVETLFTIKASQAGAGEEDFLETVQNNSTRLTNNTPIKINLIEDNNLIDDVLFKIEPIIEDNNNIIKIRYANGAFKDHAATLNLSRLLDGLIRSNFSSPHFIFELYYNAINNDPTSLHAVAKIRRSVLTPLGPDSGASEKLNSSILAEAAVWDKKLAEFAKLDKKRNAEKKALAEQRKARMAALDAAPEEKQFRYLVSIGDRKGAADLVQAYLPWEEMAPFEKRYWETHLDIIRNPAPLDQRVIIYRGIDDDMIQTPIEAGKKLSQADAILDQNIFVMSTMMTKNQGSWNRRLRSLTSMNEKFIGTDNKGSSEFTKAARITTLFSNHASKPDGSPFLSFTPSIQTAQTFGQKRISAYLIDPRALEFNYASTYAHEKEFLAPLATFPDEIAAVYDYAIHPEPTTDMNMVIQKSIIANLEKKLGETEGILTYQKVTKNSLNYFGTMGYMKFDEESIKAQTEALAKKIAKLPKVEAGKTTDKCVDIIKLFLN
ncbi:hypothetical protein SHI21_08885 [Bacteriovorax sp. PP10]|uniref:Lipoprotein n=1 Tax=Bacteriovorax antarcticus TaxID=3088717 RepID=A0ABU5VWA9_9BACT|nr:hypothetical protein [Bacteriovorax sp. PP10]MEA9356315.1 hypothetical protein [Bacteriovorax sp. PP10]